MLHDIKTTRGEVASSPRWWDDRDDLISSIEDDIEIGAFDSMYKPLSYDQMKAILQVHGMDLVQYHSRKHDCDVFDIVNAENSIVKGSCGLMDVEQFIERRQLNITPLAHYKRLFDASGKGTPEQIAYYGIVKSLESSDPQVELEKCISKAHEAISRHDGEVWNSREGYRGYYNKQIALYRKAQNELSGDENKL